MFESFFVKDRTRFIKRRSFSGTKIFFAVLFVALLIYLTIGFLNRADEGRKLESIKSYFKTSNELARTSGNLGLSFSRSLSDTSLYSWEELKEKLDLWARECEVVYEKGKLLEVPKDLEEPHASFILCLKLRTKALKDYKLVLSEALENSEIDEPIDKMAASLRKLVLSDEAYLLFTEEAKEILKKEKLKVSFASSSFLSKDVFCERADVLRYVVQLKGFEVLEEVRGVGIIGVSTEPPQAGYDTARGAIEIPEANKLKVIVTVENQGNQVEVDVPVVVVCFSEDGKYEEKKEAKISLLPPKEKKNVSLELTPPKNVVNTITITAGPVPKEKLIKNNSQDFIFIMI